MNPLLNRDKVLLVVSGVSGSGKTTFAEYIKGTHKEPDDVVICTADDFHMVDGEYKFDVNKMAEAHAWCREKARKAMLSGTPLVIVPNTNTSPKEFNPYVEMANDYGYEVAAIVMQNILGTKTVHGVPDDVLEKQENRLRSNLKLS